MSTGQTGGPQDDGEAPLSITVISFGYKEAPPPTANLVFDVRFLKNPFWVHELRPLTGEDSAVRQYVMEQPMAQEFFQSVLHMLTTLLPRLQEEKISDFSIAFGCTGGQHRSATLAAELTSELSLRFPQYKVIKLHRELDARTP